MRLDSSKIFDLVYQDAKPKLINRKTTYTIVC